MPAVSFTARRGRCTSYFPSSRLSASHSLRFPKEEHFTRTWVQVVYFICKQEWERKERKERQMTVCYSWHLYRQWHFRGCLIAWRSLWSTQNSSRVCLSKRHRHLFTHWLLSSFCCLMVPPGVWQQVLGWTEWGKHSVCLRFKAGLARQGGLMWNSTSQLLLKSEVGQGAQRHWLQCPYLPNTGDNFCQPKSALVGGSSEITSERAL